MRTWLVATLGGVMALAAAACGDGSAPDASADETRLERQLATDLDGLERRIAVIEEAVTALSAPGGASAGSAAASAAVLRNEAERLRQRIDALERTAAGLPPCGHMDTMDHYFLIQQGRWGTVELRRCDPLAGP